jgi:hypothetical protein
MSCGFHWFVSKYQYGSCQYPADRVPLHTSLKSRQVAGRVFTHYHVPYGSGPHLPAEVGSSATTCPMASDIAFRLR